MIRIVAHRGNRLHAPENSRIALLSAYTARADVLEFDVQLTRDGHLVLSHDPTIERMSGADVTILESTLAELRRHDMSESYRPRDAPEFKYYRGRRPLLIETLPEVLDLLPPDQEKLIEIKHDSTLGTGRRDELIESFALDVERRGLVESSVVYSADSASLELLRDRLPGLRLAAFDFDPERGRPLGLNEALELMLDLELDGLVTSVDSVIADDGSLTTAGERFETVYERESLELGGILYPFRGRGQPMVFTAQAFRALAGHDFVWSVSTDSMFDVEKQTGGWTWLAESFKGKDVPGNEIDTTLWSFGYAKSDVRDSGPRAGEAYTVVELRRDGVTIEIDPYEGELHPPADDVGGRIQGLEERMWYALKDWPFYSGGGFGVVPGVVGDFAAEVSYTLMQASQAETLELAAVNVDPGAHRTHRPRTFRDKDSFYDPHGAPPYVGAEHDEDDGFRINWNLGSEYDNNQYGRPVGDGRVRAGRLRLERRGHIFSAYYKNDETAGEWVCTGVIRNESLNETIYLRCVGKRWRQEDPSGGYMPVNPNTFIFFDFEVTRY